MNEVNKSQLEEKFGLRMTGAIRRYVDEHILPGSFLQSIIANDLSGAVGHADNVNIRMIPEYCFYFYNYCPGSCWGSPEKMNNWIAKGNKKTRSL